MTDEAAEVTVIKKVGVDLFDVTTTKRDGSVDTREMIGRDILKTMLVGLQLTKVGELVTTMTTYDDDEPVTSRKLTRRDLQNLDS